MSWFTRSLKKAERVEQYASRCDVTRQFRDAAAQLYVLSLMLVADHHLAEQCVLLALDDALESPVVLKDWTLLWARRMIIKRAIRMLSPKAGGMFVVGRPLPTDAPTGLFSRERLQVIMALPTFDRVVYVMSFLEGYSARDCSILLRCTDAQVTDARVRALHAVRSACADELETGAAR